MSSDTYVNAYTAGAAVLAAILLWPSERKRLSAIPTVGGSSLPILSWAGSFRSVLNSKEILEEGYARGYPAFKFSGLDRFYVVVRDRESVDELRKAPDDVLSLKEAIDVTLHSRRIFGDAISDNDYHVDIIRSKLTRNLPTLFPWVYDEISQAMTEAIDARFEKDEWVEIPIHATIMNIVSRASNRTFVGLPLCRDPNYRDLNVRYTANVAKSSAILTLIPVFLRPLAFKFLKTIHADFKEALDHLTPLIEHRLAMINEHGKDYSDKPMDMLSWVIDAGHDKTVEALTQRLLVINFAAIHTTSLSLLHALLHLAAEPKYLQDLRQEVDPIVAEEGWTKAAMTKLYKVDSFLRESMRVNSLGSLAMSRLALKDFSFSNGTFIPKGTVVAAAGSYIHQNEEYYPDSDTFNPFRFSDLRDKDADETNRQSFVTTSTEFLPFGHGRHSCPGRYFAHNEMTAMIAHIVHYYDIKLASGNERPPNFWFMTSCVPNLDAKVLFRKRQS